MLTSTRASGSSKATRAPSAADLRALKLEKLRRLEARAEPLLDFIPRVTPAWAPPAHLAPFTRLIERSARGERVNACVSVPPRHGKTETVLHAIAWWLRRSPADTLAYVSYAATQAESKSLLARSYTRASGVALSRERDSLAEWRTLQRGGCLATGIGGPLTGQGCKVAFVDDPVKNREEAESALIRQRTWDWFTSTLWTRIEPGGSCIVLHTRWHEDDLIGRLARGDMPGVPWEIVNLPAISTGPDGEELALWPERWPVSELRHKRAANEYDWASLYQGAPRPRGGAVFRTPVRYQAPELDGARIVLAVDPAGSESTRADWTVAVALAVSGHGEEMRADVLEVERFRAEAGEAARRLLAFQRRRGGGPLYLEASRDGKAIAKALRAIAPELTLHELAPRGDKFVRAQPLATAWNEGRVRVPVTAAWLPEYLAIFERFTGVSDAHDDDVDATAHAWNASITASDPDERTTRAGRRR